MKVGGLGFTITIINVGVLYLRAYLGTGGTWVRGVYPKGGDFFQICAKSE